MKLAAVSFVFPALLLAAVFLSPAWCEVYYVRGSSADATPCPSAASPCLTLQEYVDRSSEFLPENVSDVEFLFLSGEHPLSKQFYVRLSRNITLRSANVVSVWDGLDVTVNCTDGVGFVFNSTVGLSIQGIAFSECLSYDVPQLSTISLYGDCEDLFVRNVDFVRSLSNYDRIYAELLHGMCNISNVVLDRGWITIYKPKAKLITLIFNSLKGSISVGDWYEAGITASPNYSSLTLQNVTPDYTIDCIFYSNFRVFVETYALNGLYGIYITTSHSLIIANSSFSGFTGCINIETVSHSGNEISVQPITPSVLLLNCSFAKISCSFLNILSFYGETSASVTLKEITFIDNNCSTYEADLASALVRLSYLANVTMEGVHFTNNRGTPLLLENSTVDMFGENSFVGNEAHRGGGMSFTRGSLVLHNGTSLVFRNNYAEDVGGAWYVISEGHIDVQSHQYVTLTRSDSCFLDLSPSGSEVLDDLNIAVSFVNNSARNGGNVLYGGNINYCSSSTSMRGYKLLSMENIFSYELEKDLSRFASAATRVCVCENGTPNCSKVFHSLRDIYPGQLFNISVVTVGQRFGVIRGTVFSQLIQLPDKPPSSLKQFQESQFVSQLECTDLSYVIQSQNPIEILSLSTAIIGGNEMVNVESIDEDISTYNIDGFIYPLLITTPVYVNVSLLECPPGFVLSEEPPQCICDPVITSNNLTCDLDTGTVQRSGEVWVSYVSPNQSSGQDGVVVSQNCPNGFCKEATQWINVLNPDAQCNFDRSGRLCGRCSPNFSIVLGSNKCKHCHDSSIALLIPFAVCGVVLVLFIQMLDLTVTVGTINGLIFYANILESYDLLFFVTDQNKFFTVFIAWLNLDLGIGTCFFDGLDSYTKTWLQFVFPLYLWVLAGLIIVLSRYNSRFSANNSVPVLATMILLSYNKLILTVIDACAFLTLKRPGNGTLYLWKYDPTVLFMDTKHLILVLTCVLVFALAWLPYTLMLTFYQCLLRVNHKRGCRWVFKLKPFFDANFGPLKDKHIYWVGVLLLARAVLLLINILINITSNSGHDHGTIISIAIVASLLILHNSFVGHVYRNWLLSLLENSFFLNLVILCIVTTSKVSANKKMASSTSVSIAFLQFFGIVCYHGYKRVSSLYKNCKRRSDSADVDQIEIAPTNPTIVTHSEANMEVCDYASLREPLIDDD